MKKIVSVLGIMVFSLGCSQNQNFTKFDEFLKTLDENHKVMGSFALSKDDKIVYAKAIGFTDADLKQKADTETKYRIGSISKTFTAVLIMKSVEENKLKLDDKLSKFFPEVKNSDKITIENLLQHRSGIHNFTDDKEYWQYYEQPFSEEAMIKKISLLGSDFEPGSKYSYSNSNYTLLAGILHKIYKKPYAELVKNNIIKPLKLTNTFVDSKIDAKNNFANSYTFADNKYSKGSQTNLSVTLGAGNIVSTPSDLLKFMFGLVSGKIIKKETLQKMQTYKDHYGYGIFEVPFNQELGFGHNGGVDNFQSVLYYFPKSKSAFAMITNQSNYDNNQISINALKSLNGIDFEIPSFKVIEIPEADLKKFEGTYSTSKFPLKIKVFIEKGILLAQATGQGSFPLEATSKNTFKFDQAGITMVFNAEKGEMAYSQMGQQITFTKE